MHFRVTLRSEGEGMAASGSRRQTDLLGMSPAISGIPDHFRFNFQARGDTFSAVIGIGSGTMASNAEGLLERASRCKQIAMEKSFTVLIGRGGVEWVGG